MRYFEFGAHAIPEGSSSASRMALAARRLGYAGIIICNLSGVDKVYNKQAARMVPGIEVYFGVEVSTRDIKRLRGRVESLRDRYPLIAVRGGEESLNRAAFEDPKVDVVINNNGGRISIPEARASQLNRVAVGFDLSPMIRLRGSQRSKWIDRFRRNLQIIDKFELAVMLTVSPKCHLDQRAPREMIALAVAAGMDEDLAREALAYPGRLIDMNSRRWISPGVELI